MSHRLAALVAAIGVAGTATAGPSIIFVDQAAPPGGDGLDWTTAHDDLQAALDGAAPGDQVWIAEGTYVPSLETAPGDPRSATFSIPANVALFGGFDGGETALDQRDTDVYQAVLSGDRFGDDGPDFANNSENCRHVVTLVDVAGVRLDGVTVRGGNADLADGTCNDHGGGLLTIGSSDDVVIQDCRFTANAAASRGGAVHASGGLRFIACIFDGNACDLSGGAVAIAAGTPRFWACTFSENVAVNGGAVRADAGDAEFANCQFFGNGAERGGAVHVVGNTDLDLQSCKLAGNTAQLSGGAVFAAIGSSPFIASCELVGNEATSGGAVFAQQGSDLLLLGCTITANSAQSVGGVMNELTANTGLHSTILWDNDDDSGTGEAAQLLDTGGVTATVEYCCIQGLTGSIPGPGNIGLDPLFANAAVGDYRLQPESPCIDAGSGLFIGFCPLDMSGSGRYHDDPATPDTGAGIVLGGVPLTDDIGAHEFGSDARSDCNGNAYDDLCELVGGSLDDCNGNGITDICDLLDGLSVDVNEDGVPDECQDCNGNGVLDPQDIDDGLESDCNGNDVPDACEIADGMDSDVDGNGVPDGCQDCNGNGTFDPDEIAMGAVTDCNGNGQPDGCELADGSDRDCDGDGVLDACQIVSGAADCNGNGRLDDCELADGFAIDDGVADTAFGMPNQPATPYIWANQFDAGTGAVIDAIAVAFAALDTDDPYEIGDPVTLYVWDDPDNDGLPDDAVELVRVDGTVSTLNAVLSQLPDGTFVDDLEPEVFDVFPVPATTVTGSFFAGIRTTTADYAATADLTIDNGDRSFIHGGSNQPASIQSATPVCCNGTFMIRAIGLDCDGDGLIDTCAAASGAAPDDDANGVPDACERSEDINRDGLVNIDDLVEVVLQWGPCPAPPAFCTADVDGSLVVDIDDLVAVVLAFDEGGVPED